MSSRNPAPPDDTTGHGVVGTRQPRWAVAADRTPLNKPSRPAAWLATRRDHCSANASQVPLDSIADWSTEAGRGAFRHRGGGYFSVVGADVCTPEGRWQQPMISQPEIGILGLLIHRVGPQIHCLVQAKSEPGTIGGVQLAPTVQATRSNFTRRHGGAAVPYAEYFTDGSAPRELDVLQSEQGARFLKKHNRNAICEVADVPIANENFSWFSLDELLRSLRHGDGVNLDARSVLAGLGAQWGHRIAERQPADDFAQLLAGSLRSGAPAWHRTEDVVDRIHRARRYAATVDRVPLPELESWQRQDGMLVHRSGAHFRVIGVDVTARGREVSSWSQPMIAEYATGLLGFLVSTVGGVVHVLLRAAAEPGLGSGAELAPTVQCTPAGYRRLGLDPPALLDRMLAASQDTTLFDTVLSAEGGRFYRARQRHLIVRTEPFAAPPGFCWASVAQIAQLIIRGRLVNEQARSLFSCLLSLLAPDAPPTPPGADADASR